MKTRFRMLALICIISTVAASLFADNLPDFEAARQGNAEAQYRLACSYFYGNGVEKNYAEAVKWLRKAAEQGNADAQFQLGGCYYFGNGVAQDYIEAVKWFREAAEQGYANAQDQLGYCYYFGKGVAQDYAEAIKWYRKAAEQGNAVAQYRLACSYFYGNGVAQDYIEAVKWFREAAEQGYANAQYQLSACYYFGNGVEKNYAEAVKWVRKAAEQGYANAQYSLGVYYHNGLGVNRDCAEAVKWYRKAAEQGNANAQYNLGYCFESGSGIGKNEQEAVAWYRRAAEQGHDEAKQALEKLSSALKAKNTQRSISFYELAKNTSDLIAQKKESDYSVKAFQMSIEKGIDENKKKKDYMESYYNTIIASETEKQKRMKKDEFETTAMFKKRQSEQELKISNLMTEKERLSKEYDITKANLEAKKKNDMPPLFSWDSLSGEFLVDEITLIYDVSSIRYDADAGVFDIVLVLDDSGLKYKLSNELTISCESVDRTINYQKSVPNIAEAKRFKEQFKGALVSIPDCHVKRFYEYRCVQRESSYTEKSTNWNGIAATALSVGAALLFGPPPSYTNDNTVYYAPDPAYAWSKEKTVTIPAVYENTLVFKFDSYIANEKAVIQEITSNSDLTKIRNQKSKSFLFVFPPMIKNR